MATTTAPDKAAQQEAEWTELKKDLRYFGIGESEADAMDYGTFTKSKDVLGLEIYYALRIFGRVVPLSWEEWMGDNSIDYYPCFPFLDVCPSQK